MLPKTTISLPFILLLTFLPVAPLLLSFKPFYWNFFSSDSDLTFIEAKLDYDALHFNSGNKVEGSEMVDLASEELRPNIRYVEIDDLPASPACRILPNKTTAPYFSFSELHNIHNYTGISFYHARKAAGTTVRHYLKLVCAHYNLRCSVKEGYPYTPHTEHERTFLISNIRHPVSRSLSNYKYSFRWGCRDLVKNKTFVPTLENSNSFSNWLIPSEKKCSDKIWTCSKNCFIKWFCGFNHTFWATNPHKKSPCLETDEKLQIAQLSALQNMKQFDLILQAEFMSDEDYIDKIESFFGVKGFQHKGIYCERDAKRANDMFPLKLTDADLVMLKEANYWDLVLYNRITSC